MSPLRTVLAWLQTPAVFAVVLLVLVAGVSIVERRAADSAQSCEYGVRDMQFDALMDAILMDRSVTDLSKDEMINQILRSRGPVSKESRRDFDTLLAQAAVAREKIDQDDKKIADTRSRLRATCKEMSNIDFQTGILSILATLLAGAYGFWVGQASELSRRIRKNPR